ncbi:MAG TPA: arylesterase [Thermoanaerobaculia bacterium]
MWRKVPTLALALLIPAVSACGPQVPEDSPRTVRKAVSTRPAPAARPASAPAPVKPAPVVVFLGDSLTAGMGLDEDEAYPAVIERELREDGTPVRVVNAGVSGDTTAGGLSRLSWLLKQLPDVVVVALGANDGLRALPLAETEKNLREIIRRSQAAGARVLLLGMRIPPNYGPYADDFADLYPRLAKEMDVQLVPFLLEGVGGVRALNQEDGLHPTAEGQERMAETVMPYLEKVLAEANRRAAAAGSGSP